MSNQKQQQLESLVSVLTHLYDTKGYMDTQVMEKMRVMNKKVVDLQQALIKEQASISEESQKKNEQIKSKMDKVKSYLTSFNKSLQQINAPTLSLPQSFKDLYSKLQSKHDQHKQRMEILKKTQGPIVKQYRFRSWNNNQLTVSEAVKEIQQFIQQQGKYPYQLSYVMVGQDNTFNRLDINDLNELVNLQQILGKGSDILDVQMIEYQLRQAPSRAVFERKIKKAQKGMGNDDVLIQEVDNDDLYVPTSRYCLLKVLKKIVATHYPTMTMEQVENGYNGFLKRQKKSYRDQLIYDGYTYDNIPESAVNKICKEIGINAQTFKLACKKKPTGYSIVLHKDHYVWVKNNNNITKILIDNTHKGLTKYINMTTKSFTDRSLQVKKYENTIEDEKLILESYYQDVFIYDLETFKDPYDNNNCIPYSAGLVRLTDVIGKDPTYIQQRLNDIAQVFHVESESQMPEECINMMLKYIDEDYDYVSASQSITVKGEQVKTSVKPIAYLYAHNGKAFDAHVIKCFQKMYPYSSIIKSSGGILKLVIQLENCNVHLKCTRALLEGSLSKLCSNFNLPQEVCKKSCSHDSITAFNWLQQQDKWYEYLQYDCISLSLIYEKFAQQMWTIQEKLKITPIDIRKCVSISSIAQALFYRCYVNEYGNSNLYQYKDKAVREFIKKATIGGRVHAYQSKYENKQIMKKIYEQCNGDSIDDIAYITTEEAERRGINTSQYHKVNGGYQKINPEFIMNIMKDKELSSDILTDQDANSLYPSAMSMKENLFPDVTQSEYIDVFTYEELVKKYKHFIITCSIYYPKNLQFIPVPAKYTRKQWLQLTEQEPNTDSTSGNYYHTGYVMNQTYNEVDLAEIVRVGGKIISISAGIGMYGSIDNPFVNIVNTLYQWRQEVRKANPILGDCVKLIMNSLYGKQVQKDILTTIKFTSIIQFNSKYNDNTVSNYTILPNGQLMYEKKTSSYDLNRKLLPSILGCYILSYSKRIMNNFIEAIDGFKEKRVWYTDTDSLYIHKKYLPLMNKYIGNDLNQCKNDYGSGGIVKAFFIAPKMKICIVIDESGLLSIKKSFKGVYNGACDIDVDKAYKLATESILVKKNDQFTKSVWTNGVHINST